MLTNFSQTLATPVEDWPVLLCRVLNCFLKIKLKSELVANSLPELLKVSWANLVLWPAYRGCYPIKHKGVLGNGQDDDTET